MKYLRNFKQQLSIILCIVMLTTSCMLFTDASTTQPVVKPGKRQMPANFYEANEDLPRRLGLHIKYLVRQTYSEPVPISQYDPTRGNQYFGSSVRHKPANYKTYWERLFAVLANMKLQGKGLRQAYGLDLLPTNEFAEARNMITQWTSTFQAFDGIGTNSPNHHNDYDMTLKNLITLLYTFRDPSDSAYLSDEAVINLVERGFMRQYTTPFEYRNAEYYGTDTKYMLMDQSLWIDEGREYTRQPETENHVLMIYSSFYLINQFVTENYRNISAFRPSNPSSPFFNWHLKFKNTLEFEELLLNIIQRSVYSDFFEFNSRPYLNHTLPSLFNLAAFAKSDRVRTAARNAVDAACAKFAFSSLESKRYTPKRRSSNDSSYTNDIGLYGTKSHDGMIFLMGMLSGGYVWDDNYSYGYYDGESGFFRQSSFYSLFGGLISDPNLINGNNFYISAYKIPKQIHQFFLDKLNGFWARMMPRYGDDYEHDNYPFEDSNNLDNKWANYFDEDGVRTIYDGMRFTPEAYFITNDFYHVMGGNYDDQPYDDDIPEIIDGNVLHYYDGQAKITSILPKGFANFEGEYNEDNGVGPLRDVIFYASPQQNINNISKQNMMGTYKNFSCSWSADYMEEAFNAPLRAPQSDSAFLEYYSYRNPSNPQTSQSIFYKLYNLTNYQENCYLVIGSINDGSQYHKGFWEIIPPHKFSCMYDLMNYINANNSAQKVLSDPSGYYSYKLITGEKVLMWPDMGKGSAHKLKPIYKVFDAASNELNPYYYYFNDTDIEKHPLIDVRAVDADYKFTGERYCYSRGNGLWQIYNPHPAVGADKYYIIDSRNIYSPYSTSSTVPYIAQDVNMTAYNGDYKGLAITVKTAPEGISGDPGTYDICRLEIKYLQSYGGEDEIMTKELLIPRTHASDATTVYYYPPNGEISKIIDIKLVKLSVDKRSFTPSNDIWNVDSVSIDYKGQNIFSKWLSYSMAPDPQNPSAAVKRSIFNPLEGLGKLKLVVKTANTDYAETINKVWFQFKLKNGTTKEYLVSNTGTLRNQVLTVTLGSLDFPLESIDKVGFRKNWSGDDYDDGWNMEDFYLYVQDDLMTYRNAKGAWVKGTSGEYDAYALFDVNYSGAPAQDKLSESVGRLRIHIRRSHVFVPNEQAIRLRIGYDGGFEEYTLVQPGGFVDPTVFEDSKRDYMTSLIYKVPRHKVRYIELRKGAGDPLELESLQMWLDGHIVFDQRNIFFNNSATVEHWDDPNGF